ncbi:putative armadillo-like helical protein [Helianthus anomalus]
MWFHFCCHFGPKMKSGHISQIKSLFFVLIFRETERCRSKPQTPKNTHFCCKRFRSKPPSTTTIIHFRSTIPLLVHLLENAISILLSLCKRDDENLGVISRLGVLRPLMELANNVTEHAKRKAVLLLGHLQRSQQELQHVGWLSFHGDWLIR